jgi:CBS domain-containing protein
MEMNQKIRSILNSKGRDVWSIHPGASVYEALEIMSDRDIGALLVMSGDRLAGLLSERDYARKVRLMGRSSEHTTVGDIMTTDVITVSPDDTVDDCMRQMTSHRIRHLPVVESGRIAGMISIGDLVNWIIREQAQTIDHLHTYIASAYPG